VVDLRIFECVSLKNLLKLTLAKFLKI